MAIQDRNLSVGTQLYARYKGTTYTAEVAEKEGKLVYRLPDGKEFKSPSAAGSAVMGGNACNGWAFWSLDTGEGQAATGPVRSTRAVPTDKPNAPATFAVRGESVTTVTPAPKPEPKRRGRKPQAVEPPASDDQAGDNGASDDEPPTDPEARDDAPTATEPDPQPVTCAECHETFPSVEAATEHYYATHGKPEGDEPTA